MSALYTWGGDAFCPALGNGGTPCPVQTPAQVGSVTTWSVISGDFQHFLAIRADGTLWGWGNNSFGQLGLSDTTDRSTPTQIGTDTDWVAVAAGAYHSLALKANGTLWATGSNADYELGLDDTTQRTSFTQVGSGTTWTKIAASTYWSMALKADGTLWTWGAYNYYQTAQGGYVETRVPTQVGSVTTWAKIYASRLGGHAIRTDGTLWGWGRNAERQVGDGTTTARSSPVQIGSATNWDSVARGYDHCVAFRTDGTLWGWGNNTTGQLGLGDTTYRASPTQVGSGTTWASGTAGQFSSFAITDAGTLWAAGYNADYRLGLTDTANKTSFTQIGTGTALTSAETGWNTGAALQIAGETGIADADITVTVLHPLAAAALRADAFIRISVQASGTATAATSISVAHSSGSASADTEITVQGSGTPTAPVAVGVVDSLDTVNWSARVLLAGSDVSARVLGQADVDAEEGAARVARFTLIPVTGSVNPVAWTGQTVSIDLVRVIGGVNVYARLFTGRVDIADYDATTGLVDFSCTDDMQNRVATLEVADIDALCGGLWHAGVHGQIDDRWAYAQQRMASRPASLDADPHGGLRVTDWAGGSLWRTFSGSADIIDGSLRLDLPRRSEITNVVRADLQYRYHRLRERRAYGSYSQSAFDANTLANGGQYPTYETLAGAVQSTGWQILTDAYTPAPETIPFGEGFLRTNAGGVSNYTGLLVQRYAQPVTENQTLRLVATASVDANGEIPRDLRGTLASTWDPQDWEADPALDPEAYPGEVDYAPDAPRSEADALAVCLLNIGTTRILADHRHTTVTAAVRCLPECDLDKVVAFDTDTLTAQGKVARVRHRLGAGSATTEITLALSGIAAAGIVTPSDLAAPDPVEPDVPADTYTAPAFGFYTPRTQSYTTSLSGWLTNTPDTLLLEGFVDEDGNDYSKTVANPYFTATEYPVTGFRVFSDAVADERRGAIETTAEVEYLVAIPEDTLTITAR